MFSDIIFKLQGDILPLYCREKSTVRLVKRFLYSRKIYCESCRYRKQAASVLFFSEQFLIKPRSVEERRRVSENTENLIFFPRGKEGILKAEEKKAEEHVAGSMYTWTHLRLVSRDGVD